MKVIFIAAEANPLVKIGGLGDVLGALPRALADEGHEVRILLPAYGCIELGPWKHREIDHFESWSAGGIERVNVIEVSLAAGITAYLVKCDHFFAGKEVYSGDDCGRFYLFCRAAFGWLLRSEWQPDIVHCHDWHTALIPMWIKMGGHPYATVFTIHNLQYQGEFGEDFLWKAGLQDDWRFTPSGSPYLPMNFIARGILWADKITAVSSTYAEEITTPEGGAGLDALLRFRVSSLSGILNGLDTREYDPSNDRYLPAKYDINSVDRRVLNKAALQHLAGLANRPDAMLAGLVGRLDDQKGLGLLGRALDDIMRLNVQLVVVGRGRPWYEDMVQGLGTRYPGRAVGKVGYLDEFSHLIYGGADVFLMPSLYEPCGLTQMIAMRYGVIPIVRRTGGLAETVPDAGASFNQGRGFVFSDYEPAAFTHALSRAFEAWQQNKVWRDLVHRAMKAEFLWESAAKRYVEVYRQALESVEHA